MQDDALLAFEPFGERREVERNVIAVGIALRVAAGVVAQLQLQVIRFGRFGLFGASVTLFAFVFHLVDDHRERVFRIVRYGVERIEGQPLFREVERIALEVRFGAAQLFEPSRVGHDLRSAGVDVFHEIEVDVVIVIGNAVLQCEPDDDPLRFVGIGLVARDAGLVAGVERLPVVALEIVVSAVERADGGDERTERFAAVVVVAGGKSGDSYSCDEE